MNISIIGNSIAESATLKLNETFTLLKAKGESVIHLGGGEPKSKAPASAVDAATEFLKGAEVRYSPASGTLEMKKAVVNYMNDYYERQFDTANVVVSSGAKQALMVAMQTILNPGDEMLFPAPYWVSYPEMVKLTGAVPVPFRPKSATLIPAMEDIEPLVNAKTKGIILNSPNNPSGVQYPESFIKRIVDFAEKNGIYLLMDDIYHRLLFDGKRHVNVYDYISKPIEESKVIVINGVSKSYAMTGFRIGWAVAGKTLCKVMGNIQGHQTAGPSILLQKAAAAAINGDQSDVDKLRETLQHNRNVMIEKLDMIPGVKYTKPAGTFYVFADFSKYENDSQKLSHFLLEKARVLTMPGVAFGLDGYLRLSYCGSVSDIVEGMDRIKIALEKYL